MKDFKKEARELSEAELARVTGGFKYDPNYVSENVIDARGGSMNFMGSTFTFDLNGNVTSVTPIT